MASKKEKQQETVSFIHTAKAFADKIGPFMLLKGSLTNGSVSFGVSPFEYLLKLLQEIGVSRAEIEEFIANIIVTGIPPLELAVKAILLTNLKKMVSCSLDPRIPYKYRKRHKSNSTNNEHGIDIDLEAIDIFDKLSIDPLSEEGKNVYFGNKDVETVYEFVRAEDFDAFLWFVMHKGKFPFPGAIGDGPSGLLDANHGYGSDWALDDSNATWHTDFSLKRTTDASTGATCIPGNTFTYGNFPVEGIAGSDVIPLAMCDKVWYDENGKICQSEIVPISDDQVSVDWYKSNNLSMVTNLFGVDNAGTGSPKKSKSKPICNLQYIESNADSRDDVHTGFANSKFRFSILPKPKYNVPGTEDYFSPFAFKPFTFDGYGNYDRNGWWTPGGDPKAFVDISPLGKVTVKSGQQQNLIKNLYPCYNGLTVYEFNFDYVMGMRLFDAKNIAWSLIEALTNTFVGVSVTWDNRHAEMTAMARDIVKNIINTEDDVEIEDCYFSFDNTKYDELIRKAQEKRARLESFGGESMAAASYDEVKKLFDEYDENGTLEERKDVIERIFSRVSATVSEGANPVDRDKIGFNFATDLLEQLVFVLVKELLSPKLMMLLYVNKEIMGGFNEKNPSFEEMLREMKSIIIAVVKEVRDMIIAELYKLLLQKLSPLIGLMSDLLIKEAMDEYTELLEQIMRYCSLSFCRGKGSGNTILDNVDYADIDDVQKEPKTGNCD